MRIIQSYWSCNNQDLLANQPAWLAPEYNLMAWALSCLQLKTFYKEVVLYCDAQTKAILIDELKLPYDQVYCELDQLNHFHPELWALPKIHCYASQTEPFLHVDGDVFIWKEFDQSLLKNDLIAQNLECASVHYNGIMTELEKNLTYFPDEIITERQAGMPILAYNAGIFGGHDIIFFKEYCEKAMQFINNNQPNLGNIRIHNFNIFFEQYLFYCLTKSKEKKVGVLLDEVYGDNEYKGFGDFMEVPHNKQYLHILGTYKRSDSVCLQLANRLRMDYPEYYYRIISLYKSRNIPLLYDYYEKENGLSIEHYHQIRSDFAQNKINQKSSNIKYKYYQNQKPIPNLSHHQAQDLQIFKEKIESIAKKRFSKIDRQFLYGRDISLTAYYEYLFGDINNIYKKKIMVIPHFEIIESRFDWSKINNPKFYIENKSDKGILTLVVPECHMYGYSLANIDLLDVQIIELLKVQQTVGRLLHQCKRMFNNSDLEKSPSSFEKLIFGRIKKGIHNKIFKVIIEQ